ncbi:MAG: universal stress protein [Gemmatimonadales bacterium]|nr:MAG: universal stress protein [Gemmatimonadales bacterium]
MRRARQPPMVTRRLRVPAPPGPRHLASHPLVEIRPMFQRALVALDLTPAAETVLRALPALRSLGTTELVLVHVSGVGDPFGDPHTEREMQVARLRALGAFLEREGFQVRAEVGEGEPSAEIVRLAGEEGASLVVLGSRSRSRVQEAFLGNVAMGVLRKARTPVLLLHVDPDPVDASGPDSPGSTVASPPLGDHVLFATDFSEAADRAFIWVERLAALRRGRFHLLHATSVALEEVPDAEQALAILEERLVRAGAKKVRTSVERPTAARAVVDAAARDSPPLVVMGTHGRGFLGRTVLGSVARAVAQESRAPLLLVPPHSRG